MGLLGSVIGKILGIGSKKPEETLVGSILTKNLPNKTEVKKIMMEIEQEYKANEHEYEMGFLDVVKDAQKIYLYEPKIGMFLKGSTRWIIALIMTFFYIYLRLSNTAITEMDQYLISGIWGFLFVLRTWEKLKDKTK